jgi:hypothetical protein
MLTAQVLYINIDFIIWMKCSENSLHKFSIRVKLNPESFDHGFYSVGLNSVTTNLKILPKKKINGFVQVWRQTSPRYFAWQGLI